MTDGTGSPPGRQAWLLLFILLSILTALNTAWTFREPLSAHPVPGRLLSKLGWVDQEYELTSRDTSAFALVSRDLHKHDTRAATLSLSVVFVNRGQQGLAYPSIDVTLVDAAGDPVAQREFPPSIYLPKVRQPNLLLQPGVHVPVLLEFADPGARATGFQLAFH